MAIPQQAIDTFTKKATILQRESADLEFGDTPEADLSLSPLVLLSQYIDERILARY